MISCYELRIGNYVLADNKLQRISMINNQSTRTSTANNEVEENKGENLSHALGSLQPVPLTDTILQQCNFVYHDYFKFWQLITGKEENRSEMDIDSDYNIIDFMRRPVVKKVASLHQLQNIYFMLKGKELNFQEKATTTVG
jgi:hypothetical protein